MNMSSNQESMLWKVEPLSPSGTPPLDIDEEWLNFDEKPVVFESSGEETALYEENLTRAQVATKYLEELELKTWIKEESFADWLEEKIDLPIFEELPAPECGQNRPVVYSNVSKLHHHQHQQQQQQQQHHVVIATHHHHHHHQPVDATQTLLREFETVLGDVEACHQISAPAGVVISTLTPPQSPPPLVKQQISQQLIGHHQQQPQSAHLLVSLQPLHHQSQASFVYEQQHQQHHQESTVPVTPPAQDQTQTYTLSLAEPIDHQIAEQWNAENLSLVPLVHGNVSDVAHELAKVDEYVRSCAEHVPINVSGGGGDGGSGSSSSASGTSSAPPSPCTSSNASCMSSEDSADDPDWSYEPVAATSSSSSTGSRGRPAGQSRAGRRPKPYSRTNVEDKRVRKKEQNKNAATRYRQKKKQEIKEILSEEQELAIRNDKLQAQVKDLQREIGYLKGLMRDLFKAKGLIK